ncbi:MAG: hypothetical protein JW976_01090 [Syntrophaceae bacterium]|nr:hypothetical protein [Syntrophaceae bacterium]
MEIKNFSENHNYFLRQAEENLRHNNFTEALNLSAEQLRTFPDDADALGIYCEALIGMGKLEDLRESLNKVAEIISRLNLIHERAGDACRENGFHNEAASCYERFLSLRPDAEKAVEMIGKIAFLEQQDTSPSAIDPEDENHGHQQDFFTVTMAKLYIEQGHFHDAEIILEEIIKREPENRQALTMLSELKQSPVLQSQEETESFKRDNLIITLSSWLKNIERLKINGA